MLKKSIVSLLTILAVVISAAAAGGASWVTLYQPEPPK